VVRSRARGAALAALLAVEKGVFLDGALRRADRLAGMDTRERALARRIVRGVLQTRGRLDWILTRVLTRGDPSELDPRTLSTLRIGLYQILFLSSVPSHAAVHETVRLARSVGGEPAARLANGVLRRVLREGVPAGIPSIEEDPVGHLAIEESFPRWLVARWVKRLGVERAAARLRAGNETPPLSLRVLREPDVDRVLASLRKEGAKVRRSALVPSVLLLPEGGNPSDLKCFSRGEVIVQDEGAALASLLAEPVEEDARILDLCAAPGGKILPLAQSLGVRGRAVALDRGIRRMERLEENVIRTKTGRLQLVVGDALALPIRGEPYSLLLVDTPCSGLGTLARRADLRWRVREEDIARLAALALRLLTAAARMVEKGGVLVYSTCTTEPEENEETVARFLERDRRFRREAPPLSFPEGALAPDGSLRVRPEELGCDGAFGVRLRRVE